MKFRILQIIFLIAFLLVGCMAYVTGHWNYFWWLLPLFALYFGIVSWGSANIRSGLFLKTLSTSKKPRQIALTFDDGPHPNSLKVLEVLKQFEAPATFFCIGKNVEALPEIAKQMLAEGHTLGNHTYSHPVKWGWLSRQQVAEEVEKGNRALQTVTGMPNRLFRPPFGVTNPRIAKALKPTNLQVIGWDLRSLDTAIKDEEKLYHRILKKVNQSSVLLFHDTQEHTPRVLVRVLRHCKKSGIKIVPLGGLLEIEA